MVEIQDAPVSSDPFALPIPTFVPRRFQPGTRAHWCGHIAFANDLIAQHRPALLVQLGTEQSDSYFGLCQCILSSSVDCVCYGVNEDHSPEATSYNQRFYSGFSHLLHSSVGEAQGYFSDDSIDLLWIGNSHTYESALRIVNAWLTKVKPGGVVLIPDTVLRRADFRVWKLWEQLQATHQETFSFHHSGGLGVLRKPGSSCRNSKLIDLLFSSNESIRDQVRCHYALYAAYLERLLETESISITSFPEPSGQAEARWVSISAVSDSGETALAKVEYGVWSELTLELGPGCLEGPLTFNATDTSCLIEIQKLQILHADTGRLLLHLATLVELKQLIPAEGGMFLPHSDSCQFFCFGPSPSLLFDPGFRFPGPVRIQLTLRVERELTPLADLLQALLQRPGTDTMHEAELEKLQDQLKVVETQSGKLAAENASAQKRTKELEYLLSQAAVQLEKYKEIASQAEWAVTMEKDRANAALRGLERCMTTVQSVEDSLSWRVTWPLRFILKTFRIGTEK